MKRLLSEYIDSLILEVKKGGKFSNAVFYRAYDGQPAPSEIQGFSVCVGIGKSERKKKYLSIYRTRRRIALNAELEFRVSAPADAGGLAVFCERLEKALRHAGGDSVTNSIISAPAYNADINAVYRVITLYARIDTDE